MKFIDKILVKRHRLFVREEDVMMLMSVLSDIGKASKIYTLLCMEIWKCSDSAQYPVWGISFRATNENWGRIIKCLKENGHNIVLEANDKYYLV